MTTSRSTPFLSEILAGDPIPVGKLAFFRQRFRNRLYDLVLTEFRKAEEQGLTKAEIARRIRRRPEQIGRWLGAPGNWTLETVSDLLLAISKAEPKVALDSLVARAPRNQTRVEWLMNYKFSAAQPVTSTTAQSGGTFQRPVVQPQIATPASKVILEHAPF
jgi:hypothetical protein